MTPSYFLFSLIGVAALTVVYRNYKERPNKMDLVRIVLLSIYTVALTVAGLVGARSPF